MKTSAIRSIGLLLQRFVRSCPTGAEGGSQGWSVARAQPRDAEPVDKGSISSYRPGGAEETPGCANRPADRRTISAAPTGRNSKGTTTRPRVSLRSTRGYYPWPLRGPNRTTAARGAKHSVVVFVALALPVAIGATVATGRTFDLSWHTIDGGGIQTSTGEGFVLSGTIGQFDANSPATALTGDGFTLIGGFWSVSLEVCTCLSDINGDTQRDGADVQDFLNCLLSTGPGCACADLDGSFTLDTGDVILFVDDLLLGDPCP